MEAAAANSKFKQVFNRIGWSVLLVALFWVIFFIAVNPLSADKLAQYSRTVENTGGTRVGVTPMLTEDTVLSQEITPYANNFCQIDVFLGTYQRTNNSHFLFSIFDEAGKELFNTTVDTAVLADNSYYSISFPAIKDSKGKRYELRFTGLDGNDDNSISIYTRTMDDDSYAFINGERVGNMLDIILTYEVRWVYPLLLGLIMLGSFLCATMVRKMDERAFLCFALLLGVLFVVITPFRHPVDEDTHFLKSLAISRYNVREDIVDGEIGFNLPANMNMVALFRWFKLNSNVNFLTEHFSPEIAFIGNHYSSTIIPINHTVAAAGLFVARILNLSIALTIWVGRLTNYLFYVAVCYLAIKKAKYYKSLFFCVATFPAVVWMSASFSTDPVLVSCSLLFVSICLRYHFDGDIAPLSRQDMVLLMLCGVCVASVKYFIYLPLLGCFYLIPKGCFAGKQRRNMIIAACGVVVIFFVWQIYLMKNYSIVEDRNGDVDVMRQISYMLHNIPQTIQTFVYYFVHTIPYHIRNMFYITASQEVSGLISTLCIFSPLIARDKFPVEQMKHPGKKRAAFLSTFLFVMLLVMGALYVGYTPIGGTTIEGLQTRYLQPVLIFLMLPLALTRIRNDSEWHDKVLLLLIECNLLLALTGTLMDALAW